MDELTQFCGCGPVASWFRVCAYVLSETVLDAIWVNSGTAFAVAASENRNQFSYRVGSPCDVCDGALFPILLRKRDKLCFAGARERETLVVLKGSVCVCVLVGRGRGGVCVCLCVRARARACVCACARARACVCVCV